MILFVGDIHCKIDNLDDTASLFKFIAAQSQAIAARKIVFLGDLTHTHSVVRQEVGHFLKQSMVDLKAKTGAELVAIVGNHDGISPTNVVLNSLHLLLGDTITVKSSSGFDVDDDFVYLPYVSDGAEFIRQCNLAAEYNHRPLVCHQSVVGASYENGHPVEASVRPSDIPFDLVISGHIHKRQVVSNKIVYIGSPRATTFGEANDSKYIAAYDESAGTFQYIPTSGVVTEYKSVIVSEDSASDEIPLIQESQLGPKVQMRVVVKGSKDFCEKFKALNSTLLPRVSAVFQVANKRVNNLTPESDGSIFVTLDKYIKNLAIDPQIKECVWQKIKKISTDLGVHK